MVRKDSHYALASVMYNVLAMIDGTSNIAERYRYTAYGKRTILDPDFSEDDNNQSDISNPLGHQGMHHDQESGLVYNRYRYRQAEMGRWLQRDPLGYVDGLNLYSCLGLNPLMWLDPTGLIRKRKCEVEVALGHFDRARNDDYWEQFDEGQCARAGVLSCWGDAANNDANITSREYHEGDPGTEDWYFTGEDAYFATPKPSLIDGFPTMSGPIGDGFATLENRARATGGLIALTTPGERGLFGLSGLDVDDWNGGRGEGAEAFNDLIGDAWDSAIKSGEDLCREGNCECKQITIRFACDRGVSDGSDVAKKWCGKRGRVNCHDFRGK